jgi:peptidoglycan/LPS O-acetylase OafA/YrhL
LTKHQFTTMDGLRGVAALAVVTRHVPDHTFLNLLPGSYLAVDLFFVLSGFVLAYAYGDRLKSDLTPQRFMLLRVIRLYPLYAFGTALAAFWTAYGLLRGVHYKLEQTTFSLIGAALFLPIPPGLSIDRTHAFPFDAPAWSLFWELAVNALFSWIFLSARRQLLSVTLIIAGAALLSYTSVANGGLDGGFEWSSFWAGGGRVVYSFFAGVGVHWLWANGRLSRAAPSWVLYPLLLLVFSVPVSGNIRIMFDMLATIVILPAIVASSTGTRFSRISKTLGISSYGIYIIHVPLIQFIDRLYFIRYRTYYSNIGYTGTIFILLTTTILAIFLDKIFDQPARALLNNWLIKRRQITPSESVG